MDILFDINKMCRICLKSDSLGLVSIFNTTFSVRPVDMVKKLDLFKIDVIDGLPTGLCQPCICRVLDAYNLKQQSELSEIRLKEYLDAATPISYVTREIQSVKNNSSSEDPLRQTNKQKDEEIYEAMNAVCDIFDKNSTDDIEVNDDVLQDVVIDVNNLTKSENEEQSEEVVYATIPSEEDCRQHKNEENSATKNDKLKSRNKKINLKTPDKCNECGKIFSYSGYLETHMRMHTGEKPYKCEVCDKSFTQLGNLSLHKRVHTGERRYQCEICSKLFTTSSNLTAHKRSHSEVRNFKCKECFRTFKSQKELSNHEGTHTGIKDHICEICHKAFYKLSYLNVHIRTIHKGEKRYKCEECNKAFSNSSNLICHYRIHTGEKPYNCKVCNAKFNQSSALVRHMKQHTKSKIKHTQDPTCTNSGRSKKCEDEDECFEESIQKHVENLTSTERNSLVVPKTSTINFPIEHTSLHSCEFPKGTILDYSKTHHSFQFQQ